MAVRKKYSDMKSFTIDQMLEQYYAIRRELLELELAACRECVPTYSSKKRFLRKQIAQLTMLIEEYEHEERFKHALQALGMNMNVDNEGVGGHAS